ncbi:cation diffusion facilitator family transporter [bacterium]|nr:cation diffusion facilitator family transporter [bacterium]
MSHGHHHHDTEGMSDSRLWWAVAINVILTVAQVIGGVIAGSLALVADALHNLNDAASLGIALVARKISRKPPDEVRTFGYQRAQIVGAIINLTTLILVGLYLIFEAFMRFFEQNPIDGWIVVWLAGLALVVDTVTAFLTYKMSKGSLNIKAAFIHNLSDAFASVGVMIAGTLIILYDWYWTDLVATLAISAYILWHGSVAMKQTVNILMQGVPEDLEPSEVASSIRNIDGVESLHHIHIWQIDEHHRSLEAHVVVNINSLVHLEEVKSRIKEHIAKVFNITHSTLEFEPESKCGDEECQDSTHQ